MKVLHLPTSVGQNAWQLAQGEKALGVDSTVLVHDETYMRYPADIRVDLGGASTPMRALRLAREFMRVRNRYDVFHFNWGTSLLTSRSHDLHHLELPFYPRRAKLFVTYNGCDARQKYPTIARAAVSACAECGNTQCESGALDQSREHGIRKMAAYADHLWAVNPDLLHFLPKDKSSFLPYAVGLPGTEPCWPRPEGALRVVHAPTNRDIKGTRHLLAAVERVNGRHPGAIELTLVEGLSHEEAVRAYAEADLVVDQLLVGWYGAFAVEAMLLGKPVMVRIEEADLPFVPAEMAHDLAKSVIHAGPATVEAALAQCVADRSRLLAVARAGHAYARRWHDPVTVASITTARYRAALA